MKELRSMTAAFIIFMSILIVVLIWIGIIYYTINNNFCTYLKFISEVEKHKRIRESKKTV